MSSSRTASSDTPLHLGTGLVTLLGQVPDPRDPRGVRRPLSGLLAVGVAAVLAGGPVVRGDRGMGQRGQHRAARRTGCGTVSPAE